MWIFCEITALALSAQTAFAGRALKMSLARLRPPNRTAPVPTMVGMILASKLQDSDW